MEVNEDQKLLGYPHVTKIYFFVFNKRKNLIQVWNNLTKMITEFSSLCELFRQV